MSTWLISLLRSRSPLSGFYKGSPGSICDAVKAGKKEGIRILLLGVSFALLDLAESESPDLSGVIVMETGGMKGRRKELTRAELHRLLCEKLNVTSVHSEYGMTELMSQAYSSGNGVFYCPPWMKIIIRDPQDPLSVYDKPGKTGGSTGRRDHVRCAGADGRGAHHHLLPAHRLREGGRCQPHALLVLPAPDRQLVAVLAQVKRPG